MKVVDFQTALESVMALPKQEWARTLIKHGVRLEHLNVTSKGIYELEFSKPIYQDIGTLSESEALSPIPLREDQDFGTYTAALYIPEKQYLLLEFNFSGAREGRIRDYVSAFSQVDGKGYQFSQKLLDGITAKAIKKRNIPKLEMTIAPSQLSTACRDRYSLEGIIKNFGTGLGADTVQIAISCRQVRGTKKRKEKLGLDPKAVERMALEAYKLHTQHPNVMRRAIFIAKDEIGHAEEILSFTGLRLEHARILTEHTGDRKYPLNEKLEVLYEALGAWRDIL
jgi:hypothetical protein